MPLIIFNQNFWQANLEEFGGDFRKEKQEKSGLGGGFGQLALCRYHLSQRIGKRAVLDAGENVQQRMPIRRESGKNFCSKRRR